MKKKSSEPRPGLIQRYRNIPRQIHSRKASERSEAQKLLLGTLCVLLMIASAVYMLYWYGYRAQVEADNAAYSQLYQTAQPTANAAAPSPLPTVSPTATPPLRTARASAAPEAVSAGIVSDPAAAAETTAAASAAPVSPEPSATAKPTASPTPEPSAKPTATAAPSPAPTATPAPMATFEIAVDTTYIPAPTHGADTIVYAIETSPPVQEAFDALLELNPETIGFLTIEDLIALPVVQRPNDNTYYLDHSFEGKKSAAGTLFLDGSNLLVPEDPSLIIYGHNMHNGTMFQPLIGYEKVSYLKKHPLVNFDTIYENRVYVPFAALTANMDENSDDYLDMRQFVFDEATFDYYIKRINALSLYDSPVDVVYGDSVLLLVTCEYVHDNGRFILALREMRPDETQAQMTKLVKRTKLK